MPNELLMVINFVTWLHESHCIEYYVYVAVSCVCCYFCLVFRLQKLIIVLNR
jgi:hypothetical protein